MLSSITLSSTPSATISVTPSTLLPTHSPNFPSIKCVNSILTFDIDGSGKSKTFKNCEWVKESKDNYNIKGVAGHFPLICNTLHNSCKNIYTDVSNKFKGIGKGKLKFQGATYCVWVGSKFSKISEIYAYKGVKETYRGTCDYCGSAV